MTIISDLFDLKSAKSLPFDDHDPGSVAFITNGYRDNGLLGYVEPLTGDAVFNEPAICISAFCEATVPKPPFIARGNGGSGLTIVIPKVPMSEADLWAYASYISNRHGWKFSFGRMATISRLAGLEIAKKLPRIAEVDPSALLPRPVMLSQVKRRPLHFARVPITTLFNVQSGDFHSVEELSAGKIPLVSCGAQDNGIIGFYDPPPDKIYHHLLTVAYNGDYPLMAKFHPYDFAAKDDVAVLHPVEPMNLASILFVQMLLNREVWRHSYGRKLYRARLEKFEVQLPVDRKGKIDHPAIATWLEANPLWHEVGTALESGLPRVRQATLNLMARAGG